MAGFEVIIYGRFWVITDGYFAYHAVPSNLGSLVAFHNHVTRLWQRSLARPSQKGRTRGRK